MKTILVFIFVILSFANSFLAFYPKSSEKLHSKSVSRKYARVNYIRLHVSNNRNNNHGNEWGAHDDDDDEEDDEEEGTPLTAKAGNNVWDEEELGVFTPDGAEDGVPDLNPAIIDQLEQILQNAVTEMVRTICYPIF